MQVSKLRRRIAWEAARLMYFREETEYYRAKMKAARSIHKGWVHPSDLPSNAEIRDEIQLYARMLEGDDRDRHLRSLRFEALWMMRRFEHLRPRLVGSVLTGHVREGSDVDIHLFADSLESVTRVLDRDHLLYDVERKHVRKDGEHRTYTHVQVRDRAPHFELTVYPRKQASQVTVSSITGKPMERASIAELTEKLGQWYPEVDIEQEMSKLDELPDRFQVFESLLLPLENVRQDPRYHPEGDALYHSLQVYDLAREEYPYDEEFLTAALLHDVGKAIDPDDHVGAALEALSGFVTQRTAWLIEHHMDAQAVRDGTAGARLRKRLEQNESFEELLALSRCDQAGRRQGVETTSLEDAIEELRELSGRFA